MAAGWLAPLLMFWLIIWGPLRPYHYPQGEFAPSLWRFVLSVLACVALAWLPAWWFRVHPFERSGRFYEALGVRWFRQFVPDGDLVNRWRRRRDRDHRIIRGRAALEAFEARTRASEKGHLILLAMGILSAAHAWHIGWQGWAAYITIGNVLVNLFPILLQRYTRSRLQGVLARS